MDTPGTIDLKNEALVKSLPEFLCAVNDMVDRIQRADFGVFFPWFRGQTVASWSLLPGLYRAGNGVGGDLIDFERNYRYDFSIRVRPFRDSLVDVLDSEWDRYAIMQHHGGVTRLLDWTESALIALWFALDGASSDAPSAVWIINPYVLNQNCSLNEYGSDVIFSTADASVDAYLPSLRPVIATGSELPDVPKEPIAIMAPHGSKRIAAQRGMFTLHGSDREPIDNLACMKGHFAKIVIAAEAIKGIQRELYLAGIRRSMIYPDYDAVLREIKDGYFHLKQIAEDQ